jgi:acyl-CoA thioester hydrolase
MATTTQDRPRAFRWRTRVRFVDTDASQRIHYTAMFRYFEAAEQEFLRFLGCGYGGAHTQRFGFPRVRVECDFVSEVAYDDEVEIEVQVERVGNASFTLAFAASVDSRPAAKGRIVVVAMDKQSKRATALPKELSDALNGYRSASHAT